MKVVMPEPMYASLGAEIPTGDRWTFEPKYDGIRVLCVTTRDAVRLITRNGKNKAAQFPEVTAALRALARRRRRPFIVDGEIVALEGDEPARFQRLQARMHVQDAGAVTGHVRDTPAAIVLFDILVDGDDELTRAPWTERRKRLERLVGKEVSPVLRITESRQGDGERMLREARRDGWEGIIAKRIDSTYEPGRRSPAWLKLKVEFRQEFVVGGFTEPRNSRQYIGALLLGYYQNGVLVYAGNMGGGFTRAGLKAMYDRIAPLERKTPPFLHAPRPSEPVHWVRPKIVVEVKFSEWTSDGRLRQPIFVGVRDDKDARDVTREGTSVQRKVA